MDGYETVERLRREERTRDLPVIFVTAVHDQLEHYRRGYSLGAIDFIAKPFDADVLQAKVRSICALYERGLRLERRRNQEIERVKDLFLGAVGHDLRSPLNTMAMVAQLLVHEETADKSRQPHGPRIARAVARMNGIIDDILDLASGQLAGGITIERKPMDLADVVRAVIVDLQARHTTRAIELGVAGSALGTWDPRRLGRVVSNLVGNAIKHGSGTIHIDVRDEGASVALVVHNGGEPIRAEMLHSIFEPFLRGDTRSEGYGLGLFIVREIVHAHGGAVYVTSTREAGTTFTVRLPRGD
jgi:signal transduction histidine kinase